MLGSCRRAEGDQWFVDPDFERVGPVAVAAAAAVVAAAVAAVDPLFLMESADG